MHLTDAALTELARSFGAALAASTTWYEPARLYGLLPPGSVRRGPAVVISGSRRWLRLAEGDPYCFLDTVRVTDRDTAALALAACGWAFPPEAPETWRGRPSRHPGRIRVRTLTVVTPDRRQCSVIHRQDRDTVVVDDRGEGPMLRALHAVWAAGEGEADEADHPLPAA